MLTYNLQRRPLYLALYHALRHDITTAALAQGEKLPAKRPFAEHLGVSVMTVEGAYSQLCAEGYLEARPRQGYFVAQGQFGVPSATKPAPMVTPAVAPTWTSDLHSNRIDAAAFPFATWSKLVRQVLSQEGTHLLDPLPNQGLPALREAIAQDLHQYRGMQVSPEQIFIGAGAEYCYLLLAQLLQEEGAIAVEDPCYGKIRQVYTQAGREIRPITLDEHGLDITALSASGARIAHLSPSHQYPSGVVMPIGRRQALLQWAEQVDGYLIEDDYDSELRLTARPIAPLQSIDTHGRVIYLNTFSQTIAPSMRLGFVVLPPKLLERYRQRLYFYASTVPSMEQHVLAQFLSQGYYQRHLSRMRKEYRQRRLAVLQAFAAAPFADKITIHEEGAGLHFLMTVDTPYDDETLGRRSQELGLRLGFLSDYAMENPHQYQGVLVVNYASLDIHRLPQVVEALGNLLA
ncbi:PLP-dependent aminotransferase family protein [Bengtsoniella intestinalis]|uniref:MocR-like pyridoxine biosynthesis transcription factor PdxR n=1 Tax=Bengtsoniella intestinalis TaxID=3073143 RepID=UPI00391F5E54